MSLTLEHIGLNTSKIELANAGHVSQATKRRAHLNGGRKRRSDALGNTENGSRRVRHRREDSRAAAEEEDGPRRARAAHRALPGAAVEDRARADVSDPSDAAAHRARVQRRP